MELIEQVAKEQTVLDKLKLEVMGENNEVQLLQDDFKTRYQTLKYQLDELIQTHRFEQGKAEKKAEEERLRREEVVGPGEEKTL